MQVRYSASLISLHIRYVDDFLRHSALKYCAQVCDRTNGISENEFEFSLCSAVQMLTSNRGVCITVGGVALT